MDKQSYLDALKQHLQALPSHEAEEAINYFTELFDEVGPEGEEALIASLGQPEEAAKDVLGKLLENQAKEETQTEQKTSNSANRDWARQDFWKGFIKEQIQFAKEQVRQVIKQAQETRQFTVYFGGGSWRQEAEKLTDFSKVDICLKSLDISILPSSDGQSRLTYSVSEQSPVVPVVLSQVDGKLTIAESENLKVGFGQSLILEYPENLVFDSLKLENSSGDCDLTGLTINHLQMNLASGDISLVECQIREGQIGLSSGDLSLERSQLAGTTLTSNSGDISARHCQINHCALSTTSGDLQVENSQLSDSSLTTVSGDLAVETSQLTDVRLESLSGDQVIDLRNEARTSGKLQLTSGSGDVEVLGVEREYFSLNLSSQFGDIEVFDEEVASSYQLGQVSACVYLDVTSLSGDILVRD